MKAQVAIEFMIIFGLFIVALTLIALASWNNMANIHKSTIDFDAHRILTLASDRINTVYLEGDGFSTTVTIPEKIGNYDYSLYIEGNIMWVDVNGLSYSKRLLTSNITGALDHGTNSVSNSYGEVVIS